MLIVLQTQRQDSFFKRVKHLQAKEFVVSGLLSFLSPHWPTFQSQPFFLRKQKFPQVLGLRLHRLSNSHLIPTYQKYSTLPVWFIFYLITWGNYASWVYHTWKNKITKPKKKKKQQLMCSESCPNPINLH